MMLQPYSTFDTIRDSLKLAWKYKILWLAAVLTIGGFNFNNSSNSTPKEEVQTTDTSFLSKVPWVQDVNWIPYIVIGSILLIGLIIWVVIVGLIVKSWAIGALTWGTFEGWRGKSLELASMGKKGIEFMWPNFWLSVRVGLLSLLIIFVPLIITILSAVVNPIIGVAVGVLSVVVVSVLIIRLSLGSVFALRHIVLGKTIVKEALAEGIKTFKAQLGNTFKLVFGNCFVIMWLYIGILLVTILPVSLVVGAMTGLRDSPLLILVGIGVVPLGIAILLIIQALGAFVGTFSSFAFTKLFMHAHTLPLTEQINSISGNLQGDLTQ